MPVELNSKRGSKSGKGSANAGEASSHAGPHSGGGGGAGVVQLPESVSYLGGRHRTERRRAKYHEKFEELAKAIGATNASLRALAAADLSGTGNASGQGGSTVVTDAGASSSSSSPAVLLANAFPTMSVGLLTRAMGLNVSNEQIAAIVELIEEDGPSTGFVDRRKLEMVVVDALLTGMLGGSTLAALATANADAAGEKGGTVTLAAERLERFPAAPCMRDDEATLYRALEAFDAERKGYLELPDFRSSMMLEGEKFSSEEIDEMWAALRDPETNRLYYREIADVLARE